MGSFSGLQNSRSSQPARKPERIVGMSAAKPRATERHGWLRWLRWLALVLVFTLACIWLSHWQFDRRNEVVARNLQISSAYNQPPVPLGDLLPNLTFDPKVEWRPVEISGRYLLETKQLVRNRPFNGQPGFEQVVLFETEQKQLILVNRGWLPTGSAQDLPDVDPLPASETQTLIARIRADEPLEGKSAPPGQLPVVDSSSAMDFGIKQLREDVGTVYPATGFYLRLASESVVSSPAPKVYNMPELSERNHLSYAIQWLIFALLAISALVWFVREDVAMTRNPEEYLARKNNRKKTRSQLDASEEDRILDQGP